MAALSILYSPQEVHPVEQCVVLIIPLCKTGFLISGAVFDPLIFYLQAKTVHPRNGSEKQIYLLFDNF